MPGNIEIQTRSGCDANEVVMTLSSTAEANGDHYATIDFTGQSQNRMLVGMVSVEYEISPGSWIGVTVQSFLFTELGETYNLRARGHQMVNNWPSIVFPYTIHAIYAPAWANLNGVITGTPVDEACCLAVTDRWWIYPNTYTTVFTSGTTVAGGNIGVNPSCSSVTSCGPLINTELNPPHTTDYTANFQTTTNASAAFYAATLSGSASGSISNTSVDGMVAAAAYSITITKPANSWDVAYSVTITPTSLGGTACHGALHSDYSDIVNTAVATVDECEAVMVSARIEQSAQDGFWPYILVQNSITVKIGYRF